MTSITPHNYLLAAFSGRSLNALNKSKMASEWTHTIEGGLRYHDDERPAEDVKIKFFVKDFFGVSHYIGSTTTDRLGRFRLNYNLKKMWFGFNGKLTMGIVEDQLPFAEHGIFLKREATLQKIDMNINVATRINNLGTILLNFADISKEIQDIPAPLRSHMEPPSYFWKLFLAFLPELPKMAIISLFKNYLTMEQVQKIYDSFGPYYPKRSATPENLINELLNHVTAVTPEVTEATTVWKANWDGLVFDKTKSLPNVKVTATKDASGNLRLESISIKFREDATETIIKPEDKLIGWAIYLARSAFAIKGEAESHLADGHILPGTIANVFFKHIKPDNPLFAPLEPHLSQLDFINWIGSRGIIFGSGSVLTKSALDDKSVTELIIRSVKEKADWLDYNPPEALTPSHWRARGEKLHFNLLWVFFNRYIQKHKSEIAKQWASIYNWSEGVRNLMQTFPRITTNASDPTELDFLKLAKCLAWLVTKSTFVHWAAHSRQQLVTDIRQVSLAIEQRGLDKNGNPEPFGNTRPENGAPQLQISRVLLNFVGDSIFKNPNGDMDKELLALLQKHITDYKGYNDISNMHLTTQI